MNLQKVGTKSTNQTRFQHCRLLLIAVCIAAITSCGGGSSSSSLPAAPFISPAPLTLSSITIDAAKSPDVAGVLTYVQSGNSAHEIAVAGLANKASGQLIDQDDLFKIASISKLFIAVAATKLVEENSLLMTDNLAMWLPEYTDRIENSETITVEMLLTHRSGIPDFDSQTGFSWNDPHTNIDNTLAFALDKPADFLPNQSYEYSNTNYLLLAKVLDRVLGFSYETYIQTEILDTLNMAASFTQQSRADQRELVSGYWNNSDRKSVVYRIAGGSMVASIDDIGKFIRALNAGSLLTPEEKHIYPYFYNHSGWLPGYQSIAGYDDITDSVFIIFVNSTGGESEQITAALNRDILTYLNQ